MTDKYVHPRIDEIRARLAAATPGPWTTFNPTGEGILFDIATASLTPLGRMWGCDEIDGNQVRGNGVFVANAPADIAWLLEALDDEHMVAEDRLEQVRATAKAGPEVTDAEVAGFGTDELMTLIEDYKTGDVSRSIIRETCESISAIARTAAARRSPADAGGAPLFDVEAAVDLLRDTSRLAELAADRGQETRRHDARLFSVIADYLLVAGTQTTGLVPIVADPTVPPGEARVVDSSTGKVLGRIMGLGE